MNKIGKTLWLIFALMGMTALTPAPASANEPVMCTMDAKLCPDGTTYVSRTGPKCEFAPCPGEEGYTEPAPMPEPIPAPPPDRIGEPVPGGVPGVSPGNPGPDSPVGE